MSYEPGGMDYKPALFARAKVAIERGPGWCWHCGQPIDERGCTCKDAADWARLHEDVRINGT